MSTQPHADGFEVPIHASLVAPILLAGAPRGLAILNGTAAAALGLGLQQWIAGLVLFALGHSLAVAGARKDPSFASALARHLRLKAHLSC